MLKNVINNFKNHSHSSDIDEYMETVKKIRLVNLNTMKDSELLNMSRELIDRACNGAILDELIINSFALVNEAVRRVLGLNAFDVQLIAGIALHNGKLIEMQTGEGKTLSAVFPAYLNALTGRGVHILTFNDYLARRDANWMGPVFKYLGLTVGFVQEDMNNQERKKAYGCDITYVTAKEAGFDYLRGSLCYKKDELVQRPFNYAIIDEADSILVDEARIPLVIAEGIPEAEEGLYAVMNTVRQLKPGIDYDVDEYAHNVYLTDKGVDQVEVILQCGNLYAPENYKLLAEISSALHAEVLLQRDVDYIIRDGKVELIDEFTGRTAENRHWQDGLQAAVETKEGIEIQSKGRIMSQISLQSFVMLYQKIAGMTATAFDSAEEFNEFYGLDVVVIPSHQPCIRRDYKDLVFSHKEAKYKALIEEILRVHKTGQPILIGTCSVKESIYLASRLIKAGVVCRVLNAKNDEFEAHIIEGAGALGAITVSTNMAGRGTDIRLGGVSEGDREKVVSLGGLYVIGTNRYESRRIDKQLRGRAGRQGDPGLSCFFISLEDDLIKKYGADRIIPQGFNKVFHEEALLSPKVGRRIEGVQRIIEGQNSDIRRTLFKYSYFLEKQRMQIHERRMGVLMDLSAKGILSEKSPMHYSKLRSALGEDVMYNLEKQMTLYHMDQCWADYLEEVAYMREGIHLSVLGGQNPLEVFHMKIMEAYQVLQENIDESILSHFNNMQTANECKEFIKDRVKEPELTWTYLVNDNSFVDNLALLLIGNRSTGLAGLGMIFTLPIMLAGLVYKRLFNRNK